MFEAGYIHSLAGRFHVRFTPAALVVLATIHLTATFLRAEAIGPGEVFARIEQVHQVLQRIRFEMGGLENHQPDIRVANAAAREAYFQALTLFRKADQLCFEATRERSPAPEPPVEAITYADVLSVVDSALQRLNRVAAEIGITPAAAAATKDTTKTSTDSFRSIVQANRQLNLLVEHRTRPADVFQQVTFAIGYAARLLAQYPGVARIPEEPDYVSGKRPADVYNRLVQCYGIVRRIGEHHGVSLMQLDDERESGQSVIPDDVNDIASLLVAGLAYLHSSVAPGRPPVSPYEPGRKYPAHVYQRAGILLQQLEVLEIQSAAAATQLAGRDD